MSGISEVESEKIATRKLTFLIPYTDSLEAGIYLSIF